MSSSTGEEDRRSQERGTHIKEGGLTFGIFAVGFELGRPTEPHAVRRGEIDVVTLLTAVGAVHIRVHAPAMLSTLI
jgi:hypothetical protein